MKNPEPSKAGRPPREGEAATGQIQARTTKVAFRHSGRVWRIFKRSTAANCSWYFHLTRDGKRRLISLRTAARDAALAHARLLVDAAGQHKLEERAPF